MDTYYLNKDVKKEFIDLVYNALTNKDEHLEEVLKLAKEILSDKENRLIECRLATKKIPYHKIDKELGVHKGWSAARYSKILSKLTYRTEYLSTPLNLETKLMLLPLDNISKLRYTGFSKVGEYIRWRESYQWGYTFWGRTKNLGEGTLRRVDTFLLGKGLVEKYQQRIIQSPIIRKNKIFKSLCKEALGTLDEDCETSLTSFLNHLKKEIKENIY